MSETTRQQTLKWAKRLFTPVAIAFLLYFGWQSREELGEILRQASIKNLLLSAFIWCVLHTIMPVLAVVVFGAAGSRVSWWQAFSTHVARLPARYVPGGIWHTVGRVIDYHEQGVKPRHLTAFVVLENGLAAAVTLAIGAALVGTMRDGTTLGDIAGLVAPIAMLGLLVLPWAVNTRVLESPDRLKGTSYLLSIMITVVFWLGATTSFLLFLGAFPATSGEYTLLEVAGVYLFSWGVGFLAVFAPQGVGVFEVVASELMPSPIGFMGLAALLAGFRVVVLAADLTTWAIYHLIRKRVD